MDSKDFENELGPLPESDENARVQRESFKALQRLLSRRDSLIYRDERVEDFGIDCSLELKVGKYVTNFRSQAQVKATARVTMTQEGYVSFSVETANLNLLLNGTCPAYLLWEEASDEFWYTWARDQYTRLSTENPTWQSQKNITLQFRTKLTSDTLSDFEKKILDEGRFNRGLQDLIALGNRLRLQRRFHRFRQRFNKQSNCSADSGQEANLFNGPLCPWGLQSLRGCVLNF